MLFETFSALMLSAALQFQQKTSDIMELNAHYMGTLRGYKSSRFFLFVDIASHGHMIFPDQILNGLTAKKLLFFPLSSVIYGKCYLVKTDLLCDLQPLLLKLHCKSFCQRKATR